MNQIEQEKYHPAFLYSGETVQFISEKARRFYALRVSYELALRPYTMLQFTPERILDAMRQRCSVLTIGEDGKLAGFAQLWQYGFTESGRQILEFGSWLSFQSGQGNIVLKEAVQLGKRIDPNAQIVAIVEEENARAQEILKKCGAKEIGGKFSPYIRTIEGEAAYMKIFDITIL